MTRYVVNGLVRFLGASLTYTILRREMTPLHAQCHSKCFCFCLLSIYLLLPWLSLILNLYVAKMTILFQNWGFNRLQNSFLMHCMCTLTFMVCIAA